VPGHRHRPRRGIRHHARDRLPNGPARPLGVPRRLRAAHANPVHPRTDRTPCVVPGRPRTPGPCAGAHDPGPEPAIPPGPMEMSLHAGSRSWPARCAT
jgi:hypothetical protein